MNAIGINQKHGEVFPKWTARVWEQELVAVVDDGDTHKQPYFAKLNEKHSTNGPATATTSTDLLRGS